MGEEGAVISSRDSLLGVRWTDAVGVIIGFILLGVIGTGSNLLGLPSARADSDLIYQPYGAWNGKKIYLSPARHAAGDLGDECGSPDENRLAFNAAWDATNGNYWGDEYRPSSSGRNLRARGYQVRIGRGTVSTAISRSNSWNATLHIPMHSNADVPNQCGRTNTALFGTHVIYTDGSAREQNLATKLRNQVGAHLDYRSPGTNDRVCRNFADNCTRIKPLAELDQTRAEAAYMESEFHTWNRGHEWLRSSQIWAWRVGVAVDTHLGYP
jgi:N-acetylmuramoyl-L-alanine amidase